MIATIRAADGDVLDLLSAGHRVAHRQVVIVDGRGARFLTSLRALSPDAVFDAGADSPDIFVAVLRGVLHGKRYWSPNLCAQLFDKFQRNLLCQLSPTEQLGLAILGDGCSDTVAAVRLGMTRSSIRSLRRNLHHKLEVHGKRDLIRLAAQLGYTCATPEGPVALGLRVLVGEYMAHSKRPRTLAIPEFA